MNQIPMQLSTYEGTTSTGSIRLDFALQHGGLRPGSIVLIHGEEDSGKTLLSLKMVIHACQSGKPAAIIDSDGTFDTSFGIRYGVDPQQLFISRFFDPHEVLEIAALLSISGCFSMVTIDSIDPLLEDDEQGILVHENSTQRLPSKDLSICPQERHHPGFYSAPQSMDQAHIP